MKSQPKKNGWHLPLRLICCFVLATSPLLSAVTACGSQTNDSADHGSDAGAEDPPEVHPGDLTGWLILCRGPAPDASCVTGEATLGADGETLNFQGNEPTGATITLELHKIGPQTLHGTWTNPSSEVEPVKLTYEPASHGFTGTVGETPLAMNQAERFEQSDTGVWNRRTDQVPVLLALDIGLGGSSALLSILDADGDWPEHQRYKGRVSATDPLIQEVDIRALRYGNGSAMHVCLYDWDADEEQCDTLDRAPEQSPNNGVWIAGNKNYNNLTEWYVGVTVEHGNTLYIHERDEILYDTSLGLVWALRAVKGADGEYRDTDRQYFTSVDWVGHVNATGTRITGHWDEWEQYYHSYDRLISPDDACVTGEASSLSIDWFDAPSGDPEPVQGSASVVLLGNDLTIVDRSGDGHVYRVDATWTGYQFEGHWYDVISPSLTSPWRGQLLHNGWYLRGTWEKGEYSFLFAPLLDQTSPPPTDAVQIFADPYDNYAAVGTDPETGNLNILHKHQDRLVGATVITQDGPVQIKMDERLRVTSIVGPNRALTFHWAADGQTAQLIDDDGFQQTAYTIAPDFSDIALLARLDEAEAETGRDLTMLRTWLADNPGRLAATVSGAIPAPTLDPLVPWSSLLKEGGNWLQAAAMAIAAMITMFGLGTLTIYALVAAVGAMTLFGFILGLVAVAALLAAFVIVQIAALKLIVSCDPCTMFCHKNCSAD